MLNAVVLLVAAYALLLAPAPPPGSHCVDTYRLGGRLQMVLSCDSFEFIKAARHPGRLSMPGSFRQSRPLEIAAASLVTLLEVPNPGSYSHYTSPERDASLEVRAKAQLTRFLGYFPYGLPIQLGWFPFVLLNFVIMLVALMVFRRLAAPAGIAAAVAVAVLGVFVAFSDVMKGFFWSAHTQMWNVLMPLIAITLADAFLRQPVRSWKFMAAAGGLLGIGMLAYASLVVCIPVALISITLGFWMNRQRPALAVAGGKVCLFLAAFVAPTLGWTTLLKKVTGEIFIPESQQFREFVWLIDYWKAGGAPAVLAQMQVFGREFLMHVWNELWPAVILLAIAAAFGLMSPPAWKATLRNRSFALVASVITFLMCLAFFALMGFYRDRLAYNVAVPVFVIASVILTDLVERLSRTERIVALSLVALAAAGSVSAALLRITWPY